MVGGEGVRLTLSPVEDEHELSPQPLAIRVVSNEALELIDELRASAERKIRLHALLERNETQFVEPQRFVSQDAVVRQVTEWVPSPERQGSPQALTRSARLPRGHRRLALVREPLEPPRVYLLGRDVESVAGSSVLDDRLITERCSKPGDIRGQRGRARWGVTPPELVDELVGRDWPAVGQDQEGEERPLTPPAETQACTAPDRFHGSEHAEFQAFHHDAMNTACETLGQGLPCHP